MRLSLLLLSLIFAAAAVYGRIQSSGIASTVDLLDSQVASRSAAARDDKEAGFRVAERVSRLTQEAEAVEAELRVIAAREEEVRAHKCGKQDFVRRAKERLRVAKMQTEADFESKIKDKKDRAAEEIAAMEAEAELLRAEIAAMHAEEQRLATDASKAEGDLVIGGFLLNGEFGAVERFLDRVVRGVDTFRGTFVLNRQVISPDGAPLTVARAGNRLSKIGAVTDPLRRAIPKSDPFIFPAKVTYASCAVVGKSKVLLLRELGPDIDAADAVLRMDDATTKVSPPPSPRIWPTVVDPSARARQKRRKRYDANASRAPHEHNPADSTSDLKALARRFHRLLTQPLSGLTLHCAWHCILWHPIA